MTALGFIETKGLIGAIEAADAMLKAADVRLLEKSLAGGGLVTVSVAGEVAAVQSSVDAAAAAIARIPGAMLVSRHVIARPDGELEHIIATEPPAAGGCGCEANRPAAKSSGASAPLSASEAVVEVTVQAGPEADESVEVTRHSHAQLKKMNVGRLRQVAQDLGQLSLTEKEAASLDKKALLEVIMNAYRQIEE